MKAAPDRGSGPPDTPRPQDHPTGLTGSLALEDHDAIRRLARALSAVKRRIHHPKLPSDSCYAGVAYRLPDPPMLAAKMLLEALGPLPEGKSIDRIDPSGDYELPNLRYATPQQQTANRRPQRRRAVEDEEVWEDE